MAPTAPIRLRLVWLVTIPETRTSTVEALTALQRQATHTFSGDRSADCYHELSKGDVEPSGHPKPALPSIQRDAGGIPYDCVASSDTGYQSIAHVLRVVCVTSQSFLKHPVLPARSVHEQTHNDHAWNVRVPRAEHERQPTEQLDDAEVHRVAHAPTPGRRARRPVPGRPWMRA